MIVAHRHVGIERVRLEHHRDVAITRRETSDVATTELDDALGDFLETGDHAQQRRLAAAALADEHHERTVGEVGFDTRQHDGLAEALAERTQPDVDHVGRMLTDRFRQLESQQIVGHRAVLHADPRG
jgi:hypothetical protein